jgi:hypothetical protein
VPGKHVAERGRRLSLQDGVATDYLACWRDWHIQVNSRSITGTWEVHLRSMAGSSGAVTAFPCALAACSPTMTRDGEPSATAKLRALRSRERVWQVTLDRVSALGSVRCRHRGQYERLPIPSTFQAFGHG